MPVIAHPDHTPARQRRITGRTARATDDDTVEHPHDRNLPRVRDQLRVNRSRAAEHQIEGLPLRRRKPARSRRRRRNRSRMRAHSETADESQGARCDQRPAHHGERTLRRTCTRTMRRPFGNHVGHPTSGDRRKPRRPHVGHGVAACLEQRRLERRVPAPTDRCNRDDPAGILITLDQQRVPVRRRPLPNPHHHLYVAASAIVTTPRCDPRSAAASTAAPPLSATREPCSSLSG